MRMYELKLALILMLIVGIAVATLTYINSKTQPLIEENQKKAEELALRAVLPQETITFENFVIEDFEYYLGYSDSEKKQISGYAFKANGAGYSSTIKTMVGVNPDFIITGIKIISQQETPGLGTKVTQTGKYQGKKQAWLDQFLNRSANEIFLDKDNQALESPIEAISGATISSKAVTTSVVKGLEFLKRVIQQNSEEKP